jgi:hypothetical protein
MKEDKFIRQQTWTQTVVSQHAIHATLSGLEMNALILFATFYRNELSSLQKILFTLSLVLICISVWCIIWMVNHERREAFNPSQVTEKERENENRIREILNTTNRFSIIIVSLLLAISVF